MVTALVIVVVVFIIVVIINDILNVACRLTMEKCLSRRLTLTFLPKGTMFFRPGQLASRLRQEVTSWRFKHFCAPLNWHRTVCCDYIECNWYRTGYNGSSCNSKEISFTLERPVFRYLILINSVVWSSEFSYINFIHFNWIGYKERMPEFIPIECIPHSKARGLHVSRKSRNFSGVFRVTFLFVSSKRRRSEARNFAVIFVFLLFTTYEKTSFTE